MSGAQLALPIAGLVVPIYEPEATIQDRFEAWTVANPWVIPTCEHLIRAWLEAGHRRVGIKAVWEQIRWQYGMTTGDTFKANNDFTSRAARLILQRNPHWADAIETRELRAT